MTDALPPRFNCTNPSCGRELVVLPPALYALVGELSQSLEVELNLGRQVSAIETDDGLRFVIPDVTGQYTCPVCGERRDLPSLTS